MSEMDSGTFLINILKVKRCAQDLIQDSPAVRIHFKEWRSQRQASIDVVEALSKKMGRVHTASNAAKGTGATVAVVGGVATIAGIVLQLTGHQTASKWVRNGNIAQMVGSLTTTSATFAEFGLTKNVEKEIKAVLEKDIELMKVIDSWIQRSVRFNSAVKDIFGYDIQSELLFDVLKLCYENLKLVWSAVSTLDAIILSLKKQVEYSEVSEMPQQIPAIVLNIMERISDNPKLIEPFRNMCEILMKNMMLMDMSLAALKLHYLIQTLFSVDLMSNILAAFRLPGVGYASGISRVASNSVGIALNVVVAIFAAQNIRKGSEYSEKLRDLAYVLKKELHEMDSEYKGICNWRMFISKT